MRSFLHFAIIKKVLPHFIHILFPPKTSSYLLRCHSTSFHLSRSPLFDINSHHTSPPSVTMSPNQTQQPSPPGSSDSVSPPPGASSSKKRTAAEAQLEPSNRRTSRLRTQEPDESQPEEVDRDQSEHEHATDPIDSSHPREPSAGPSSAASAQSRDGEPSGSSPARLPSNAGQRWTPEAVRI